MLNAATAKQIKSDSLTILRLENGLDARDWATVNNYLRTTKNLREVDVSGIWSAMDSMAQGLENNHSLTRLSVGQELQDHDVSTLVRILKANTGITKLYMQNCYNLGEEGMSGLARMLKSTQTITHLDIANFGHDNEPHIKRIISALEDSPNIVHFMPNTEGKLGDTCVANRAAAARLLKAASDDCENISAADMQDIITRLPSILHTAEDNAKLNAQQIAKLLVNLEDVAASQDLAFSIPSRYADIAGDLPRAFRPSADKVDFSTAGAPTTTIAYQAVEAGQVDGLLNLMKDGKWKISVEACLFKPEGKRENLIELVARQGKLAEIMSVAHWVGDARGFKQVAEAAPAREWRRQMKDGSLDRLISQINAASFKKTHRPQMRLG